MRKPVALAAFHGNAILVTGALTVVAILSLYGCQTTPQPEPSTPDQELTEQADGQALCPDLPEREIEKQAIELLDQGESADARKLLECVLKDNPRARRARSLLEQLDADPLSLLGSRHYVYTVQSSETLSKIASDRLGDPLKFVVLARYNDIPVPANLVAGQRLKIPGERPSEFPTIDATQPTSEEEHDVDLPTTTPSAPASPSPSPPSSDQAYEDAIALEQQGDLSGAYRALEQVKAEDPQRDGIDDDLARVRQTLIASLEDQAYDEELAGNVPKAIEIWQRLLEIDPRNIPAQLSLRRLTQ